jgi:hypothetical protein
MAASSEPVPVPEPEPTFQTFPSVDELLERVRARLKDPVDTAEEQEAMAVLQQEVEAFQYIPSDTVALEEAPEEPVGTSFLADMQAMEERLEKLFGGTIEVSCGVRPCVQYGDFDGDKLRDMAVQVVETEEDRAGIAVLLSNGTHALVGAGQPSELGEDLLWVLSWKLMPRQVGNGLGVSFRLADATREAAIEVDTTTPGKPAPVVARWLGEKQPE